MATEVNLTRTSADPERLLTLRVSHDMLPMLGVSTIAGRGFLDQEDRPGASAGVLVSQSLARRLFERPESALGQTITLDEQAQNIVGVVPDTTDFGVLQILSTAAYSRSFADRGQAARVDVWMPLQPNPSALPRETHPIFIVGRLAAGSTRGAAQAEIASIAADLEREFPVNRGRGANVEMLSDVIFGPVRPTLYLLAAAVFVVLLIACVNVANLQLARGAVRTQEVAIRSALGAGKGRLFRQFITESIVLTYIASAVGVALAYASMKGLLALAPADVPRVSLISLDGSVFGAALIMASVVAITFGVIPALQARRVDLVTTLKDDGAGKGTAGPDRKRVRGALVVAELAAAVMLLSGSGLLIRSFWNLQHVAPGFQPDGVLKAEFQLPASRYPANMRMWPNFPEHAAFARAVLARASALPGVTGVAIAGNHPLDPGFTNSFRIVGREGEASNWPEISVRAISPGYLDTVRLPLVRGRQFTDARNGSRSGCRAHQSGSGRQIFPRTRSDWRADPVLGCCSHDRRHRGERTNSGAFSAGADCRLRVDISGAVGDWRGRPADPDVWRSGDVVERGSQHLPRAGSAACRVWRRVAGSGAVAFDFSTPVRHAPGDGLCGRGSLAGGNRRVRRVQLRRGRAPKGAEHQNRARRRPRLDRPARGQPCARVDRAGARDWCVGHVRIHDVPLVAALRCGGTRSDHDARCGRASCRDCDHRVGVAGLARVTAGSISDTSSSGLGPAVRSG